MLRRAAVLALLLVLAGCDTVEPPGAFEDQADSLSSATSAEVFADEVPSTSTTDAASAPQPTVSTTATTTTTVLTTTSAATTTTTSATTTTTTLPAIEDLAAGLFCRDLFALGYRYTEAMAYWDAEGAPLRMDADRDGVPCETVWASDDVIAFWGTPLPIAGPTNGEPTLTCINGWTTPIPGTELYDFAAFWASEELDIAEADHLVILMLRYFIGYEDDQLRDPFPHVERWYIEARSRLEPTNALRLLLRRKPVGQGPMATAPFGTEGFEEGTWTGYEGEGVAYDPFTPACLPENGPYCDCGWGISGCSCLQGEQGERICSGPPPEVMGCLGDL